MKHNLLQSILLFTLLCLPSSKIWSADSKTPVEPTPAEQTVIDQIMAADPEAKPKLVRNKYCPITGKPVDPAIPPLDCPEMFGRIHKLVGVGDAQAHDVYEAAREGNKYNQWGIPGEVIHAAGEAMMVDLTDPKKPVKKPIILPPELMAPVPPPQNVTANLTIDAGQRFQTIDGFGACTYPYSGAVHKVYAMPEIQKMVVEDLGLSMVRFEITPNHFKQVENPEEISRNDFIFEGNPPEIPINEKSGKPLYRLSRGAIPCLEFIAALKKLDPEIKVTPSVWAPPGWMKTNQRPDAGGSLKPEFYPHFAQYLVEWSKFVKERFGFDLYALSPQNELEFRQPYNSCIYTPEEYRDVVKTIGQAFQKAGLDIKLFGPEDMTHYGKRTTRYVEVIEADPEAKPFLDIIATHGYADGIQLTGSVNESADFWELIKHYDKPYWQTETGTGAADGRWNDGGPDGTMAKNGKLVEGALSSVGGRLHYALAYGHASGWLFWQITDATPNEAALMVLDQPNKKYYVAKHFYRWIRPGAVRIAAGPDGGDKGLCVTAFQHDKNKTVTVVLLNRSNDNVQSTISLKTDIPVKAFDSFRTSEKEDCVETANVPVKDGKVALTLPPRSIVTLYGVVQ